MTATNTGDGFVTLCEIPAQAVPTLPVWMFLVLAVILLLAARHVMRSTPAHPI
jgi:hypothetical protein